MSETTRKSPEERAIEWMKDYMARTDLVYGSGTGTMKGKETRKAKAVKFKLVELLTFADECSDLIFEILKWQQGIQEVLPEGVFDRMKKAVVRGREL